MDRRMRHRKLGFQVETYNYLKLNSGLTLAQVKTLDENIRLIKYGSGITLASLTAGLSLINGTAFVTNPSVDLRQFLGFKFSFSDGSKTLVGWPKAAGTGETPGDELITNPDMELDSNWTTYETVTENVRSDVQAHGGTYSRKFTTAAAATGGIKSAVYTTTTGALYKRSAWIYPDNDVRVRIASRNGANLAWLVDTGIISLASLDTWNQRSDYLTETSGGAGGYFLIHSSSINGSRYIDDVSFKQLLTPSATGVTIVSAKGGSTYNWLSDGGINPNAASFTVTITAS